jgi:hypothetical protein
VQIETNPIIKRRTPSHSPDNSEITAQWEENKHATKMSAVLKINSGETMHVPASENHEIILDTL